MSSLSSPASSRSASSTTTTAAAAAAAFAAPPPSSGLRPHASSEHLRTSEAGPALDRRTERRRSTLSGSDRKRRIVSLEADAWSRRAVPEPLTETGPSSSSRAAAMDSRPIPRFSSFETQTPTQTQTQTPQDPPPSSYANPIDLTSPPPQSRPQGISSSTDNYRRGSWSRTGTGAYVEYTRPQWQPDAEVTKCPICGTTFSFWYRKHHCRKCGRVVCASCSPHRITIPRQFIVRDPNRSHASSSLIPPRAAPVIDLEGDDAATSPTALNPALGGGEEVRLCNPCVPDPNPDPPRGFATVRSRGGAESRSGIGQGAYPTSFSQSGHRSYHSVSSPANQNPHSGGLVSFNVCLLGMIFPPLTR